VQQHFEYADRTAGESRTVRECVIGSRRARSRRIGIANNAAIPQLNAAPCASRNFSIMRDDDDRMPFSSELLQHPQDFFAVFTVQRACGLIGQDNWPSVHQRAGNRNPLLLSAGQGRWKMLRALIKTEPGKDIHGALAPRQGCCVAGLDRATINGFFLQARGSGQWPIHP